MPKFYVQSGNLKRIVVANNHIDAAATAVLQVKDRPGTGTSDTFIVGEKGFVFDRPENQFGQTTLGPTDRIVTIDEVMGVYDDQSKS